MHTHSAAAWFYLRDSRLGTLLKSRCVVSSGQSTKNFGSPPCAGFVVSGSWRSHIASESIAARSEWRLVLDEAGMCKPRIIGETVYMLGNITGKARANDRGHTACYLSWFRPRRINSCRCISRS
ncbi:DUF927 domain-containing protein [Pseudomonas syringae]|uniref:DUF927 domain-containing protein n=1 Tax=Pseudomonas syringae TaxID=317 RepID=A0A9Q4A495_PSESX|nr:DUF927 domain-containing protein [Pseudomonas syringae]MCF5474147.1 DUF927 domain-containing protein [Pseudomonas syringae]MCF5481123.1 DUF927 domain-containing protein [Pseudomonas syringae]MCF5490874.1 DUF927 domain-containing protein [Pseudomonas syringae]MCF5495601.1 DUF927 domain-containing protein [Pseudomonas syringae]